jgi:hypothetical protein
VRCFVTTHATLCSIDREAQSDLGLADDFLEPFDSLATSERGFLAAVGRWICGGGVSRSERFALDPQSRGGGAATREHAGAIARHRRVHRRSSCAMFAKSSAAEGSLVEQVVEKMPFHDQQLWSISGQRPGVDRMRTVRRAAQ